jgi:REP element-mobilizing transposase RayT
MEDAFVAAETKIICYCLMPNHYHFLIQQLAHDGISRFMALVCNSYAKAINKQRGTTGHVFEGKYKIKHIDTENYLLWLSTYVHRNPKEAHLVPHCVDWEFSSLHDLAAGTLRGFLDADVVLSRFRSVSEYVCYVEDDAHIAPDGATKYLFPELG